MLITFYAGILPEDIGSFQCWIKRADETVEHSAVGNIAVQSKSRRAFAGFPPIPTFPTFLGLPTFPYFFDKIPTFPYFFGSW